MSSDALASGVLLIALGLWLILRTVTHDDQGHNLVDRVLALG
jgi:ABC-type nickel/cobalt efflux system permease component RcnA